SDLKVVSTVLLPFAPHDAHDSQIAIRKSQLKFAIRNSQFAAQICTSQFAIRKNLRIANFCDSQKFSAQFSLHIRKARRTSRNCNSQFAKSFEESHDSQFTIYAFYGALSPQIRTAARRVTRCVTQ